MRWSKLHLTGINNSPMTYFLYSGLHGDPREEDIFGVQTKMITTKKDKRYM